MDILVKLLRGRIDAEREVSYTVDTINNLLRRIDGLNDSVARQAAGGAPPATAGIGLWRFLGRGVPAFAGMSGLRGCFTV